MKQHMILATYLIGSLLTFSSCSDVETDEYILDYEIVTPYTNSNSWTAYEAFNTALLDPVTHIYKRNISTPDGANSKSTVAAIWTQAMYFDMAINAYERAVKENNSEKQTLYKNLVDEIFEGNRAHYVNFDWHDQNQETGWFIYDDIMWWTLSFGRAYGLFKDEKYLALADESFCRVWYGSPRIGDRGSYDPVGGGMYWNWNPNDPANNDDKGKMACINNPTVIAAMHLYNSIPSSDTQHQADDPIGVDNNPDYPRWHSRNHYLENAKEIYNWAVEHMFDPDRGIIIDGYWEGSLPNWETATLYNQATFIGASVLLYKATGEEEYLNNAIVATDYTINTMSAPLQILPRTIQGSEEQHIYMAIFAQYIAMLIHDCDQTQYLPFVERNINYGWNNRDESSNLSNGDFAKVTSEGANVTAYDASGLPALMILFPTDK
ncbi:MAG: glycoside hydrolase family 76 protein [Tannerellaceae bacterium]|nr:glycoside hydrolase family 76 protein [Tannerellaceae bacterium]